jgi:drug/metabolite transporter (DMT)-like permease
MDIVLALVAALLFALGTVLQQRAGMDEPEGGSDSGLLLRMARRPVWLAGIAADALGFVGQAIALSIGRLAIVQPLLVSSVVFALPLGARITGQRVTRADIGAAVLVVAALVAFLTIADPSGGRDDAPFGDWVIAGGACAAIVVPLFVAARHAQPARRAALLGIGAGILFGLCAALTKAVADQLADDPVGVLVHWQLYALIALGYVSVTLSQLALSTGVLAPAIATSMAFDPIASVVLGVTLLEESIHESPLGVVATAFALVAALVGIAILSRSPDGPPAAKPASGEALGSRPELSSRGRVRRGDRRAPDPAPDRT